MIDMNNANQGKNTASGSFLSFLTFDGETDHDGNFSGSTDSGDIGDGNVVDVTSLTASVAMMAAGGGG